MNLYTFIIVLLVVIVEIVFRFLNRKDIKQLLNRLMAKDYKEYQYYEKEHAKDMREKEAIREEAREEREGARKVMTLEQEIAEAQKGDKDKIKLEDFEEDWEPEESK